MNFKKVSKKYRPIPFWSWNDKLDVSETKRQVKLMNKAGMGGFFMHARGGLVTEYMGNEWMDNIKAASDSAGLLGMRAFAYDENGWPSGFGGDAVSSLGVDYQLKYLRVEEEAVHTDTSIATVDDYHFYYDVNPFYVDNLDKNVVRKFIETAYEPYYEKFGNKIKGFFTDEPQLSRDGIPWSFVLPFEFKSEYGEELIPHLPELFYPVGDYKTTRVMFWRLVSKLFCEAYAKQIYDWCDEKGYTFTGHMLLEESMSGYISSSGSVMASLRYFHIPGMDWLGRGIFDCLTPYEVGSIGAQFGKEQIISETFALAGHNVSMNELKGIYEWQMSKGINMLCPHLEGYTNRGIRKRDYPPAMYYQQPWWKYMKTFTDSLSREGMVLSQSKPVADTLIIMPLANVWAEYNGYPTDKTEAIDSSFINVVKSAERKHICFHLGDEIVLEEDARVENGKIIVGEMEYSTVVLPDNEIFLPSTVKLVNEFIQSGGKVISADELENNDVVDNPEITYLERKGDGFTVHFFVNSHDSEQKATINKGNLYLDTMSGELKHFGGKKVFRPYESLLVVDNGKERRFVTENSAKPLDLAGVWTLNSATDNSLVLDYCDYYFDGELIEKNGYVLNILGRAVELGRPVDIKMVYRFNIKSVPNNIFLGTETPEIFDIKLNGCNVDNVTLGYFCDKSIKKINIKNYVKQGENVLELYVRFEQSERVYKELENAKIFESAVNKLRYDMEIEQIYIIGDFGVYAENEFSNMSSLEPVDDKTVVKGAYYNKGGFYIDKLPEMITLKEIEKQGFLFFAGSIKVSKNVYCDDNNSKLVLKPEGVNVVAANVNGCKKIIMFEPYEFTPKKVNFRQNKVELEIVTNLRNLMGPFHNKHGDIIRVTPGCFYKEGSPFSWKDTGSWDDGYVFMERSLI